MEVSRGRGEAFRRATARNALRALRGVKATVTLFYTTSDTCVPRPRRVALIAENLALASCSRVRSALSQLLKKREHRPVPAWTRSLTQPGDARTQ